MVYFARTRRRCSALNTIKGSVHSRRIDPINLSAKQFCQGERKEVGRSLMPIARTRALKTFPNARSLSRIRYFGALSHGNASVIWRASHSAVGFRVTAIHNNRRREWPRIRNANSCSKAIVGTTKRSIEAIPSIWLRRKVFHVCNGRSCRGTTLPYVVPMKYDRSRGLTNHRRQDDDEEAYGAPNRHGH